VATTRVAGAVGALQPSSESEASTLVAIVVAVVILTTRPEAADIVRARVPSPLDTV